MDLAARMDAIAEQREAIETERKVPESLHPATLHRQVTLWPDHKMLPFGAGYAEALTTAGALGYAYHAQSSLERRCRTHRKRG